MKYVSYILSVIAIILLFNIFLSYASVSYRGFLKDTKDKMMWVSKTDVIEKMSKDQMEINSKILNSIDKLNENIDNLSKNSTKNWNNSWISNNLTNTWETQSWTVNLANELEIPWTLLTKLQPKINPIKSENSWIFDTKNNKDFDWIEYITYIDTKKRIKIFVFDMAYSELKDLFKSKSKFSVNEVDNFFGFTFFLNPIKKDIKVRFVTQVEWKAVWFELLKNSYELIKEELQN